MIVSAHPIICASIGLSNLHPHSRRQEVNRHENQNAIHEPHLLIAADRNCGRSRQWRQDRHMRRNKWDRRPSQPWHRDAALGRI